MDKSISNITANLTAMWNMRPPREQAILLVLGVFLLVLLFEMLVYQPLRTHYADSTKRFTQAVEDYQWLQAQSAIIKKKEKALGGELVRMSLDDKIKMFENSLNQQGIVYNIKQKIEDDGKEIIEITIKEISGKKLLRWIDQQVNFGYLVHSITIDIVSKNRVASTIRFEP